MNTCILYYSQTGNTRKLAATIANTFNIPAVYDITTTEPSIVKNYNAIFLGTPVHGFNPSKESIAFIKCLPQGNNQKTILFCTYRLWKGRTFSKLKKEMRNKGYNPILCVSAKGKEFSEEDFSDAISKIAEKLKE